MKTRSPAEFNYEPPNQLYPPQTNPDRTQGSVPYKDKKARQPSTKSPLLITSAQASQQTNEGVSITVNVRIGLQGGQQPYSVDFAWSDGVTNKGTSGVIQRTFRLNQTIPASVKATARSADRQTTSTTILVTSASPHIGGFSG